MAFGKPISIDPRGNARRADQGGGGDSGSSNPYRDWTTLDIHDASLWQRRDGPDTSGASLTSSGGVLTYSISDSGDKEVRPGTNKGTWYIHKLHLKPYEECGLAEPTGVGANHIYPEQFSIKVELEMDDIPITGPTGSESDGNYGADGQVLVGFAHYATDQSGAPALPNGSTEFVTARCFKNQPVDPTSTTSPNLYKSGNLSGNNQSGATGATWKCQFSPRRDVDHNCLIFQATFGATSRNSADRAFIGGGSYSTTNPRARFLGPSSGSNAGNAHKFTGADDRFVHIAIGFCAFNNTSTNVYSIRCKSLRYLIQPLSNREAFNPE